MPAFRHTTVKQLLTSPTLWLGIVAALLYCSWPLGFILNPAVSHHDFASQLEASGQPYDWLFILLDVLTGIALLIGGIMQWRKATSRAIKLSIVGYMLFGLLVIIAALAPYNCNTLTQSCSSILADSPLLIIHGLSSSISVLFLLGSLLLVAKALYEHRAYRWLSLTGIAIIIGWGLSGIAALVSIKHHHIDEVWIQYSFIAVCSFSIFLAMTVIDYLRPATVKQRND